MSTLLPRGSGREHLLCGLQDRGWLSERWLRLPVQRRNAGFQTWRHSQGDQGESIERVPVWETGTSEGFKAETCGDTAGFERSHWRSVRQAEGRRDDLTSAGEAGGGEIDVKINRKLPRPHEVLQEKPSWVSNQIFKTGVTSKCDIRMYLRYLLPIFGLKQFLEIVQSVLSLLPFYMDDKKVFTWDQTFWAMVLKRM